MKLLKNGLYFLGICLLSFTTSCDNDDDISGIIGGLDFVVATLNAEGNEVGVVPSTVPGDNRVVYTVDFGDPNGVDIADGNGDLDDLIQTTSGPMVRYEYPEETATYTITVTASLPGKGDVSITKDHTVIFAVEPPPGGGDPLVGTWRLAPEAGAFGIGPALGDASWFSNSTEDVTTRACLFDDEYVFNADGTFQNILGADTWLEPWQGVEEGCGVPVFPHNGEQSPVSTYSYNAAGSVTINGTGAFLGLAKVVGGSELASPGDAPEAITYMAELSEGGNTLQLNIEIATADGTQAFWGFKLVKDAPPEPSALDGTWRLAPEANAFGIGPALGDASWFSNSSEDVSTRACLFDDQYVFNSDGTFQNVLGTDTWLEAWQGVAEGCGTPVFPHDGTASATYDYNESAGTITIDGEGAFLGLAKVINGGELSTPGDAPSSITYMAELSPDGNTLELDIEIATADGTQAFWGFKLVKDVIPTGIEGTWKLAPEANAFGIGPALNDGSWFSNSTEDVSTRACLFDDEYVFNTDGTFQNVLGADTWLEAWQGVSEGCGTPVFPHDGTASATYDYDESAGEITIDGEGAFLGLAKVINGGELTTPGNAPSSITYMAEMSADGNTLELDIEIATADGTQAFWGFKLARQ